MGGRQRPSDDTEAAFIKRLIVLENESIFQKYHQLSWPKDPFFRRFKNFVKLNIFYKNFLNFRKIIFQISIFLEKSYKYREIPCENGRSSTLTNDSNRARKIKKYACNIFRAWTKNEENFQNVLGNF